VQNTVQGGDMKYICECGNLTSDEPIENGKCERCNWGEREWKSWYIERGLIW